MTSFQASLLRAMIPLVLLSAGAVYALDAWREYRTKQELSQRLVRRGADFVAQRFDQVLQEAELGARVLATGGPHSGARSPGTTRRVRPCWPLVHSCWAVG